jgi:hypothetical protein
VGQRRQAGVLKRLHGLPKTLTGDRVRGDMTPGSLQGGGGEPMIHIALTGGGAPPVHGCTQDIGAQGRERGMGGMIKAGVFIRRPAPLVRNELDEAQVWRNGPQRHDRPIFKHFRRPKGGGMAKPAGEALFLRAQVLLKDSLPCALHSLFLRGIPVAFPLEVCLFQNDCQSPPPEDRLSLVVGETKRLRFVIPEPLSAHALGVQGPERTFSPRPERPE